MTMKEKVQEIKEKMNSGERIYRDIVTIGNAKEQGFKPLDFFDLNNPQFEMLKAMPINLNNWDVFLKLMNAALLKGKDFNDDTPFIEFYTEMGHGLEPVFLLKRSVNSSMKE